MGTQSKRVLVAAMAVAGIFGALTAAASAAPVSLVIKNSGFESPAVGADSFIPAITDWTTGFDSGVGNPDNSQYTGTTGATGPIPGGDGFQSAYDQNNSFQFQDLDGTLNPGGLNLLQPGEYTLTVAVGNRLDVGIGEFYNVPMAPYIIKLMVGTTVLATATGSSDALTDGQFTDIALVYTANTGDPDIGQPLRIQLESTGSGPGSQANYDNVRLALLVPEPSALSLLGVGGLLAWRRRRR